MGSCYLKRHYWELCRVDLNDKTNKYAVPKRIAYYYDGKKNMELNFNSQKDFGE